MKHEEFEKRLRLIGLSKEEFSNLTNTPIPTIRGWFAKRKHKTPSTPKWVLPFLELYEQNNHYKEIIKYLEEKSNGKN